MESVHHDRLRGVPGWLVWAMVPVMLAAGFVAGMALAVYRPLRAAPAPPEAEVAAATPERAVVTPATPQADSSWRIVPTGPAAGNTVAPWDGMTTPDTQRSIPPASRVQFTGPATDIREARLALQSDFSQYKVGSNTISIEYQQMRQAAMGVSLVGLIPAHDYEDWVQALRTDPEGLKRWLQSAAERVQEASTREHFHLAWAVVDVVRDEPAGFGPAEVTLLDSRSYLVTRPLASTVDHTKTEVSLRSILSLENAAIGQPVTSHDPWAAYGPVLRFDATDIYRPDRVRGAQPLTRP